jgi:hypothetical protein
MTDAATRRPVNDHFLPHFDLDRRWCENFAVLIIGGFVLIEWSPYVLTSDYRDADRQAPAE